MSKCTCPECSAAEERARRIMEGLTDLTEVERGRVVCVMVALFVMEGEDRQQRLNGVCSASTTFAAGLIEDEMATDPHGGAIHRAAAGSA